MRPIGTQMRALLEASEILGRPATSKELVWMASEQIGITNGTKVCSRAIGLGLMWGSTDRPRTFQAVRGWRAMADKPEPDKPLQPAPQLVDVHSIARRMGPLFNCWGYTSEGIA